MNTNRILAIAISVLVSSYCYVNATVQNDSLFTPYKLNYLPAGSPVWMAQLASPDGLDYNAMVDSFNHYLKVTPGARYKSRDTKQVVNHFRRFQKAYLPFVQKDGAIRLPRANAYHEDMENAMREADHVRESRRIFGNTSVTDSWRVISPIVTYDYLHKQVSPAQSNIQRMKSSRSNPNVLYCGSETGMVFRSTDKGESWTPCANGEWMSGEIKTIDVSNTNDKKVIVGGGGVYWLSTDGGDVWENVTPNRQGYATTTAAEFHPENDNIIVAGDRSQLWRSTDSGKSWNRMMSGMVFDVRFSIQNPDVCYVAIEQDNTVSVYKSIDAGATWNKLTLSDDLLISARIGLSEAPTGADYVYVWACRRNHLSQPGPLYFSGPPLLYKSTDAGSSFLKIDLVNQMEHVDRNGGQGYYDMVCEASATNPEHLLLGIIQLYRSTDGGHTISNIGGYYGKFDLHCDMQSLHTNHDGDTWLSTDGGVIYSNDFFLNDAQPKLNGLYASEMWGFDQGWNEDVMVGGRNHNGNMSQMDRYNGVTISMRGSEFPTGYVFLSNPKKVAFSDSENVIMPDNWQDEFVPFLDFWTYPKESSQHGIGFEFDPRYAKCFYIVQGMHDEDYKTLWRTQDDGASFSTVYTFPNPISAVALSRSNPDKIVIGTWGRLYYSMDAGKSFVEYEIPDEMTYTVTYKITIHPTNENEIWVSDCNPGGFWRTVNNGASWERLNDGLTIENWEGKIEEHQVGRFFLTGNEKNAAYAIASTLGYLNETYSALRGRVLYRDDTTEGWINISDGLPRVINLNRMLPFYKNGVIRMATNNGIWERGLVDSEFAPIAQPLILNVGSGDNTQSNYPREIHLESYSIVNQKDVEWKWEINPAPLSITSTEVRNPVMTIEPNQTYDITLTVTTPVGTDTKCVKGMIKGRKPVPEATGIHDMSGQDRDVVLQPGNVISVGQPLSFIPSASIGSINVYLYDSQGRVVGNAKSKTNAVIETHGLSQGVYFFMATGSDNFKKTGKLLLK